MQKTLFSRLDWIGSYNLPQPKQGQFIFKAKPLFTKNEMKFIAQTLPLCFEVRNSFLQNRTHDHNCSHHNK